MEKLLHEQLRDWADIAEREGLSIENVIAREITDGLRGNLSCSDQIGLARILANEIERDYIPRSEHDAEIERIVDARGDSGPVEKLSHNVMRLYAMHKGMPMEDGESITDWLGRWFIERPRYEDGEPVQFGDEVFSPAREVIDKPDEHYVVEGMRFYRGFMRFDSAMSQSMNFISAREGERVRRPAPKVYDADGTEIEVGDTVYNIHSGKDAIVEAIFANGRFRWRNRGGGSGAWSPDSVSHQRPVFDAEGERIKVGHTVWDVDSGEKLTVVASSASGS